VGVVVVCVHTCENPGEDGVLSDVVVGATGEGVE